MKNLKTALVAASFVAAPFMVSSTSFAVQSGTISNTGNGSNNQIVNNDNYSCTVDNNNNVTVTDNNNQVVGTGNATSGNNQGGGNATSGNASNSNGSSFKVEIVNGDCDVVEASVPVTPTPEKETPAKSQNGQGMGAVTAPEKTTPTVLADTSSTNVAGILAAIVAAGVATVGAIRLVALSRR